MVKDDIISFGNYKWRVLDIKEGKALIITEEIIGLHWYNDRFVDVTWAECELRKYLNNWFYSSFNQEEKERIITVVNRNPATSENHYHILPVFFHYFHLL